MQQRPSQREGCSSWLSRTHATQWSTASARPQSSHCRSAAKGDWITNGGSPVRPPRPVSGRSEMGDRSSGRACSRLLARAGIQCAQLTGEVLAQAPWVGKHANEARDESTGLPQPESGTKPLRAGVFDTAEANSVEAGFDARVSLLTTPAAAYRQFSGSRVRIGGASENLSRTRYTDKPASTATLGRSDRQDARYWILQRTRLRCRCGLVEGGTVGSDLSAACALDGGASMAFGRRGDC